MLHQTQLHGHIKNNHYEAQKQCKEVLLVQVAEVGRVTFAPFLPFVELATGLYSLYSFFIGQCSGVLLVLRRQLHVGLVVLDVGAKPALHHSNQLQHSQTIDKQCIQQHSDSICRTERQ
jgi:hypothetical protein